VAPIVPSVEAWVKPPSELNAIAPWKSFPNAFAERIANRAISAPVAITAPSIPMSWLRLTLLISPPMPTDWIAPSSGSSGQIMNLTLSQKLEGAVTKPLFFALAMTPA
jgi:hypothetical protein